MNSSNLQSTASSRAHTGQIHEDQLDRCGQVQQFKARILQLQKNQAEICNRRQKLLQNRQQRLKMSQNVSHSIQKLAEFRSKKVSATFNMGKSRRQLDQQIYKYESIANITQQQNDNLKQQNEYLLAKLNKMREKEKKFVKMAEKAQKYKRLYEEVTIELGVAQEKCKVYKKKAEQMKRVALLDVGKLEDKILPFVKTMDESYSGKSQVFTREPSDDSIGMQGKQSLEI